MIALTFVLTTSSIAAQKQQSAPRQPAPIARPALQSLPKAAVPVKRAAQPAPSSSARKATPEIVRPAAKTSSVHEQSKSAAPSAPGKAPDPSQSAAKSPIPSQPKTTAPADTPQNNSNAASSVQESAIAAAKAAAADLAAKVTTPPSAALDPAKAPRDAAVDAAKAATNAAATNAVGVPSRKTPIDPSTLKQNIDTANSGLKTGASDGSMTAAGKDMQQNKQAGDEANKNATVNADGTVIGTGSGVANKQSPFNGLERGKFSSARDAGGFGTERANASAGSGGETDDTGTLSSMLKAEGGKSSGDVQKDLNELAYAQSVGSDGYAATKNMSQTERQSYWDKETQKQLNGAGRPREDDAGGPVKATGSPTVDRQVRHQAGQSIGAKGGSAGGGNDPRTDNSQGQGGGTATVVKGADDGTVRSKVDQSGTLSLEKALQINETTNPVRTGAQK
jgi:hypothetical protein